MIFQNIRSKNNLKQTTDSSMQTVFPHGMELQGLGSDVSLPAWHWLWGTLVVLVLKGGALWNLCSKPKLLKSRTQTKKTNTPPLRRLFKVCLDYQKFVPRWQVYCLDRKDLACGKAWGEEPTGHWRPLIRLPDDTFFSKYVWSNVDNSNDWNSKSCLKWAWSKLCQLWSTLRPLLLLNWKIWKTSPLKSPTQVDDGERHKTFLPIQALALTWCITVATISTQKRCFSAVRIAQHWDSHMLS